ncbi:MAG: hypothetical protein H7A28_06780 [Thermotogae bacterium]|nr:hypothetical protein [Thermotogota bacterium]
MGSPVQSHPELVPGSGLSGNVVRGQSSEVGRAREWSPFVEESLEAIVSRFRLGALSE